MPLNKETNQMASSSKTLILELYGVWNHSFIAITPSYILLRSESTCKGHIKGSDWSVWKLLVLYCNASVLNNP